MTLYAITLALLLFQGLGDGSNALPPQPREIRQLYWDLTHETKVWIRIVPVCPGNQSPLLDLLFAVYFSDELNPYTGRPKDPKGPPKRITVQAQAWPLTVIRELSPRITADGKTFDLTAPGTRYDTIASIGQFSGESNGVANGVEAELEPAILRSLISAQDVGGQALGLPIKLNQADQVALAKFARRIGVSQTAQPAK